jgi:4-aminobutyrate aminotransferase/(S)-3-amino-2-methylpropionate transaminase
MAAPEEKPMSTNTELAARHADAIPRGVATATTLYADRAQNAEIWDVEGKRYIDFAGGIAVLNVGHRHPRVMAAVRGPARPLHPHRLPGDAL